MLEHIRVGVGWCLDGVLAGEGNEATTEAVGRIAEASKREVCEMKMDSTMRSLKENVEIPPTLLMEFPRLCSSICTIKCTTLLLYFYFCL